MDPAARSGMPTHRGGKRVSFNAAGAPTPAVGLGAFPSTNAAIHKTAAVVPGSVPVMAARPTPAQTEWATRRGSGKNSAKKSRLSKAEANRLQAIRANVGMTKHDIKRLARKAGVKRIAETVFEEAKMALKNFITPVIVDAITLTEYSRRSIVTAGDIVFALKRNGITLYGFGHDPVTHLMGPNRTKRAISPAERARQLAVLEAAMNGTEDESEEDEDMPAAPGPALAELARTRTTSAAASSGNGAAQAAAPARAGPSTAAAGPAPATVAETSGSAAPAPWKPTKDQMRAVLAGYRAFMDTKTSESVVSGSAHDVRAHMPSGKQLSASQVWRYLQHFESITASSHHKCTVTKEYVPSIVLDESERPMGFFVC